jgi:hypothetical protein
VHCVYLSLIAYAAVAVTCVALPPVHALCGLDLAAAAAAAAAATLLVLRGVQQRFLAVCCACMC